MKTATGVAEEGQSLWLLARLKNIGITDWQPHANPVTVWGYLRRKGRPVRTTVSDLGRCCWPVAESQRRTVRRAGYYLPHCR